jgi:hypothetical protein
MMSQDVLSECTGTATVADARGRSLLDGTGRAGPEGPAETNAFAPASAAWLFKLGIRHDRHANNGYPRRDNCRRHRR